MDTRTWQALVAMQNFALSVNPFKTVNQSFATAFNFMRPSRLCSGFSC
jgi:hypothetical protein